MPCLAVPVCAPSPACCLGSGEETRRPSSNRIECKELFQLQTLLEASASRPGSAAGQHFSYAAGMPATARTLDSKPLGKSQHSSARLSRPWDTHGAVKIKMVKFYRLQQQRGSRSPSTPSSRDHRQKASRKAKRRSLRAQRRSTLYTHSHVWTGPALSCCHSPALQLKPEPGVPSLPPWLSTPQL